MLHDLACIAMGFGIYLMFSEFKKFRVATAKKKITPSVEFWENPNPVEARMLFNKDQVLEVLAVHTAMKRQMPNGNYSYHGLISLNQSQDILNVRIEIKKSCHE